MIQYQIPIRNNTPQLVEYVFKNETNAVIDLTNYVGAFLETKLYGQLYSTLAATFTIPRTSGQTVYSSLTFIQIGIWDLQFYVVDGGGNKLFGEPIQIKVVDNVEDLSLNQLASY